MLLYSHEVGGYVCIGLKGPTAYLDSVNKHKEKALISRYEGM